MKVRVSKRGAIVLPMWLRPMDDIAPGQQFLIERVGPGEYVLRRSRVRNRGLVDWLLAGPEKGFFEPIPSESTEAVRPVCAADQSKVASRSCPT